MNTDQIEIDRLVAASEESIAKGSKSFALASRLLPGPIRRDVVMLYAWCRYADDVIDGQSSGFQTPVEPQSEPATRLADLERRTKNAVDGEPNDDPVFQALAHIAAKGRFQKHHPLELIEGFRMDVSGRQYAELADTLDYCYHVAGTVGVMMAGLMGVDEDAALDSASDLGIAFQLTNIARDIFDDAALGRLYLPKNWLNQQNLELANLTSPSNKKAVYEIALRLLAEADAYYQSAANGYPSLPFRARWSICAAARIYREIGERIRKIGPHAWDERITVSTKRKMMLAGKALADAIFANSSPTPDARKGLYQRPLASSR